MIEGNRRLTAVKLLCDDALCRELKISNLPRITREAKIKLETLPVVICTREEIWAFLGFKHINGPQAWESYPKASYVAWVHNDLGVPLEEISRRIGDKHSTVARLYDAMMVLEQAEEEDVFDREDRYRRHFSFSHLTTGLGYSGVQAYLGLPKGDRTIGKKRPIAKANIGKAGEFLTWLYGSKSKNVPPVVQSQNPDLRHLDEVLKNKQAVAALQKGLPLSISLEISKGDDRVFRSLSFLPSKICKKLEVRCLQDMMATKTSAKPSRILLNLQTACKTRWLISVIKLKGKVVLDWAINADCQFIPRRIGRLG